MDWKWTREYLCRRRGSGKSMEENRMLWIHGWTWALNHVESPLRSKIFLGTSNFENEGGREYNDRWMKFLLDEWEVMEKWIESGGGLATTFTDTQKNRDSEIAFSAILDLGNINYSLEFFCPYREASHGWSRVLPCSFRRWIACPLYSDHSVSRSRSLREPHEV